MKTQAAVAWKAGAPLTIDSDSFRTAGGDIVDSVISNENQFNTDWDGDWQYAVHEDDEGYSVEWLIPWSIAPMKNSLEDTLLSAIRTIPDYPRPGILFRDITPVMEQPLLSLAVVEGFRDAMQTTPAFVYLIPIVMLFGIGNVPGVVVTVIFALPPMIRLTMLGIRQVPTDLVEAAHSFGASPSQLLFKVQLPLAMPTIMAGVNQTLMMALAMVVVAAMIGVQGLGQPVLRAINNQHVALGLFNGLPGARAWRRRLAAVTPADPPAVLLEAARLVQLPPALAA